MGVSNCKLKKTMATEALRSADTLFLLHWMNFNILTVGPVEPVNRTEYKCLFCQKAKTCDEPPL
jgi:predicted lipoprotein